MEGSRTVVSVDSVGSTVHYSQAVGTKGPRAGGTGGVLPVPLQGCLDTRGTGDTTTVSAGRQERGVCRETGPAYLLPTLVAFTVVGGTSSLSTDRASTVGRAD